MSTISDEIKSFADNRLWRTKKARIEAEARLNKYNILSIIVVNYYTFLVLALSIWSLILDSNSDWAKYITIITVIVSVGLFGGTILVSSMNFKEKAEKFKKSYIAIEELEVEVKKLTRSLTFLTEQHKILRLSEIEKSYAEILNSTDNHSPMDNLKVLIDRKNTEVKWFEKINYYFKRAASNLFIILLFTAPILVFFLIKNFLGI
ncbi:SLATT domain-containing protein [Paenibacillus tyrfis]|uniref:SLATT domain-containing protein n=1 Tax=Paenibacillus tyrfis TaxID=1501230 RepID=UPI000B58AD20|nr:SLATT domain-containing protein [Paenibacillus tyrfis]